MQISDNETLELKDDSLFEAKTPQLLDPWLVSI